MPRRSIFAGLFALSLTGSAFAVGPDYSNLNGNPAYDRARALIEAGEHARAIPLLMELRREFRTAADIPNWLGFCYRKLKDDPATKAFCDEVEDLAEAIGKVEKGS